MIITIDGPVASGKSSVAKLLAEKLEFYHVNTGLLYRAVAYLLRKNWGIDNPANLTALPVGGLDFITRITYTLVNDKPVVSYEGVEVTPFLKDSAVDQPASVVSANAEVRERLLDVQRAIGRQYNIVADGRDCGSVVYPYAEYKFFLTAPLEVRAQRMAHFLQQQTGVEQDLALIREHITVRDKRDAERAVAPLQVAKGALVIDNGAMTIEQTVQAILSVVQKEEKHP